MKPLAALVRRPRNGRDAFVFGAAAGTGFAMIENVMYASGWFFGSLEGWLPVAVIRMLGSGLHAFGGGLVAWGLYQLGGVEVGRWRRFGLSYWAALTAHGLWNGSVAVTLALATARETGGLRGRIDAYSWGTVLLVLLAALGVLITGALLLAATRVRREESPLPVLPMRDARTPQSVAAWALVSSTFLIPITVLVLVYPDIVAL
jgi:RsiW-degrading membrane proteinase PrsW (M82 family)